MDFSNNAFRAPPKVSEDTMSHANLVMACHWGWTSTPDSETNSNNQQHSISNPEQPQHQPSTTSTFNNIRSKRFAPCQGRLYHQLLCSHRIRTDVIEDCGANCVEPYHGSPPSIAFICNACIDSEASDIWAQRKAQHSALYPPITSMNKEQYDDFFASRQHLEAETARERKAWERDLRARMRPSNACSPLETSSEETEFATELDSLSLAMMAGSGSTDAAAAANQTQTQNHHPRTARSTLPTDSSEQLHWCLNSLALDRGACGVEYSALRTDAGESSSLRHVNEEELWRKPRE